MIFNLFLGLFFLLGLGGHSILLGLDRSLFRLDSLIFSDGFKKVLGELDFLESVHLLLLCKVVNTIDHLSESCMNRAKVALLKYPDRVQYSVFSLSEVQVHVRGHIGDVLDSIDCLDHFADRWQQAFELHLVLF